MDQNFPPLFPEKGRKIDFPPGRRAEGGGRFLPGAHFLPSFKTFVLFFNGPSSFEIGTFDKDNAHCQLQYTLCQLPSTYSEISNTCYQIHGPIYQVRNPIYQVCGPIYKIHYSIYHIQLYTHPHISYKKSQTAIFFNDERILMKDVRRENNEVVVWSKDAHALRWIASSYPLPHYTFN